jgi:thioredoxin-related protein
MQIVFIKKMKPRHLKCPAIPYRETRRMCGYWGDSASREQINRQHLWSHDSYRVHLLGFQSSKTVRYASHKSIMFSRKHCYFCVRPKKNFLERVFLGRKIIAPQVRRVDRASKAKLYHIIHVRHRDEVEAPITDWLREAYEVSDI